MVETEIEIIRKTISILDSADYKRYSEGKANTYLEYASGVWVDEKKLIAPILFPKFLERILKFKLGDTIGTEEATLEGRDTPDYIPTDSRTHPFLFDCKGMDTLDLSKYYPQIKRYLESQNVTYGILTNMRDLSVYTLESKQEIEGFKFSFAELYKDFSANPANILEWESSKHFLRFVESFRYTPLTLEQKFKRIMDAKLWTGTELLNINLLTKRLHHIVERIDEDVVLRKNELLTLKEIEPERLTAIVQEIEMIASEIERGKSIKKEQAPKTLDEILNAPPKSTLGRAFDVFCYRISYFTMTRLLLARAWEDIGFIDQTLYDGGLAKWYENFNREIRRVLIYTFQLAADRYKWLFSIDNNYTWYEPSNETLIEVLYEFSNFYLGKLNQDVLGTIYEEYIDKIDKKQKGQYYTPREIVEFIWDRVGFIKDEQFFAYKEGKREPRLIFDPATGSGGFLVEAIRRMREDSKINYDDFQDVLELRTSILTGIFGSEISLFPYYITEVNLLIQLTPVLKRMLMKKGVVIKGTPALGVVPVDALSLYNPQQLALEKEQYDFDQTKDLLPLENQKKTIFEKIKKGVDQKFSYCCANPPYVSEKGHKELFRGALDRFPYWRTFYQGKMDYFYFFIILGLSKLGEGGKLGFITTAYWPTANGASILRKYILKGTKIKEMVFFEDVKIFEYAKGQHNMVLVLEKCQGNGKSENRIKIVKVLAKNQDIVGSNIREKLKFLTHHIQEHIDKDEWQDNYIRVHWGGVKQGELPINGGAWTNIFVEQSFKGMLEQLSERGEQLQKVCDIIRGVDSSADRVTPKTIESIPAKKVEQFGIKKGDGIFLLTEAEKDSLKLQSDELELVKPTYKNSDICLYFVDVDEKLFILYPKKTTNMLSYPNILGHLEKFREILENRGGHKKGEPKWYLLHRSRKERILCLGKIVCSRWGSKGPEYFGFQTGDYYEGTDTMVIAPKESVREDVLYILAILNSGVIKKWLGQKVQRRGYRAQSALFEIPIYRIDFNNPEDVILHNDMVDKVKAIREKMSVLAHLSKYFKDTRLTHLKAPDPLPCLDLKATVEVLLPEHKFSLRTHPQVKVNYGADFQESQFILSKVGEVLLTLEGAELKLYGKNREVIFLKGEEELLRIIGEILGDCLGEHWVAIKQMPLIPQSIKEFEDQKQFHLAIASELRNEIQNLQTSIDMLVSQLYGVSMS